MYVCMRVRVRACVRVRAYACARACACVCGRAGVYMHCMDTLNIARKHPFQSVTELLPLHD